MPLIYEPRDGWAYSVAIDGAGKIVERVNGGIRLGDFIMKKYTLESLGIALTGFGPLENEELLSRLCPTTERNAAESLEPRVWRSSQDGRCAGFLQEGDVDLGGSAKLVWVD